MKKPEFNMFTFYTRAEEPDQMDPFCLGLSMSTVGVSDALREDDVINAVERLEVGEEEPMNDLIEAHGEVWVIATCYDRKAFDLMYAKLWAMLIDPDKDAEDPAHLVPRKISALRQAAYEVIVGDRPKEETSLSYMATKLAAKGLPGGVAKTEVVAEYLGVPLAKVEAMVLGESAVELAGDDPEQEWQ